MLHDAQQSLDRELSASGRGFTIPRIAAIISLIEPNCMSCRVLKLYRVWNIVIPQPGKMTSYHNSSTLCQLLGTKGRFCEKEFRFQREGFSLEQVNVIMVVTTAATGIKLKGRQRRAHSNAVVGVGLRRAIGES